MMTGPEVFNADVLLHSDGAYLNYDISDITSMPGSRCVAVQSTVQTSGPVLGIQFITSKQLQDGVDVLVKQDRRAGFRSKALDLSSKQASVVLKVKNTADRGIKIVVFL